MDGFGDLGIPPYFTNSVPVGNTDAEMYQGVLPSLGIPEHIAPSYDTSDFTMWATYQNPSWLSANVDGYTDPMR